jgi:hypothetical protein
MRMNVHGLPQQRLVQTFACLVVILLVLVAAATSKPSYNWDMLAYVGVAKIMQGETVSEAHAHTYAEARATLPDSVYSLLATSDAYRATVAADTQSFREQLPFYTVKPAYPALIAVFESQGINGIQASVLISRLSVALLSVVCCIWLTYYFRTLPAAVLACLLVSTPYVFGLCRYSTPDALSSLMILTASLALANQRRFSAVAIAALAMAVLCRPDSIVFTVVASAVWSILYPEQRIRAAVAIALGVGIYAIETRLAGSYGWLTLTAQSFGELPNPYPASHPGSMTLSDIALVYVRQAHPQLSAPFLMMLVIALIGLAGSIKAFGLRNKLSAVTLAACIVLVLHWLVAPGSNDRIRTGYHLITLLAACISVYGSAFDLLPERIGTALFVPRKSP